jgi:hypothetical protein
LLDKVFDDGLDAGLDLFLDLGFGGVGKRGGGGHIGEQRLGHVGDGLRKLLGFGGGGG